MSLYLRVKRRNQTFFVLAEPHDTFLKVKETLASILALTSPNQVQLWHTNKQKELLDAATVADQEIENDAIIFLCLKKESMAALDAAANQSLANPHALCALLL
ncbi:hypothetical protein, variant [Aphanomyces invadans]|uniref:Ubiquitin-like domain-containing protein n=1 Tax=Aphanomyces invadans TaxID=157072 RepID=A0A024TKF1_9STRA|nr:hypothetical protein, variant [Aphanomyces invadans]ETV94459.1 hypothetical protein, variant [Aphanomyces invadans]|eukprot:XP_008876774.1 hypothetical protein, variant [Aphanomyces invadans]